MGLLSPHRRFIDPGNTDGIPGVSRHSPAMPRREPLPGTRTLLTPKDPHLHELVSNHPIERLETSRTAGILGILALGLAFLLPAFIWINPLIQQSHPTRHGGIWIFIAGLSLVHLLAIFSQILSSGRNLAGSLAVPVVYVGFIVCAVIDHLIR